MGRWPLKIGGDYKMDINMQQIDIEKLNPAKYNPRVDLKPGDPEYEKLKRSIKEFGYVEPIVWNSRTGNVVGGHQRLKILQEEGYKKVNVSVVDLSDSKEKALNIALNKISGDWNEEKLSQIFKNLQEDINIDVELTGFEIEEINDIVANFDTTETQEDDFELEEELEKEEVSITQPGDLWVLGRHRLLCGDSTKKENVVKLMDEKQADLLLTDPPYNVNYESDSGMKIENDNLGNDDFYNLLLGSFTNMHSIAKEGAPIYVFHADTEGYNFRKAFTGAGFKLSQGLIWVKHSLTIGRQDYQWRHESILYGWKEGAGHKWYGKRDKNTVLESDIDLESLNKTELIELLERLLDETPETTIRFDRPTKNDLHPTMKPIGLIGYLLKNSSVEGNLVVDLFGGSGSTLIASEQMNRICYTMDMDPRYCDAIVKRYIQATGDDRVQVIRKGQAIPYEEIA
ncbi:site-specific DNA-methyltransferase [Clostridium formicaceticum]|uniref:Methyltransferase n=2 Tax=Clostridium formicaceticum TaxID=1497 RepID=A0AAC9RL76_9CLOT|nr:putative methyltransferase [Clostridium formicaceticum]